MALGPSCTDTNRYFRPRKYFSRAKYFLVHWTHPSLILKYTCWKWNALCIIIKWLCLEDEICWGLRAFCIFSLSWLWVQPGCQMDEEMSRFPVCLPCLAQIFGGKCLWCVEGVKGIIDSGCWWCFVLLSSAGLSLLAMRDSSWSCFWPRWGWCGRGSDSGLGILSCTRAASPAQWLLLPRSWALPAPNWVKGWTWKDYMCTEQGAAPLFDWFALFNFWFSESAEVMTQWAMLRCNLEISYIWWVVPSNTVWSEY